MDKFFDLNNCITLKYQEIQLKFADGVLALEKRILSDKQLADGLHKLVRLKDSYEKQLLEFSSTPAQVADVNVCFRCFDKEQPCTDCD